MRHDNPKILLITYAFPPLQAAESFLSLKALSKVKSHTIDVLTVDLSEIGLALDESLEDYSSKYFGTIYKATPSSWITSKIFARLRYFSFFPDRFRFFNKVMYKKGLEIGITNYDLVISWSQWHSVHLVALKLKKAFPLTPWLAHLSDPWADNPFLTRFPGYKASQYFLERSVIKNADAVNFTTNLARMLVMKKYSASWVNKTYITPHSFDDSLYPKNKIKTRDKAVINYLGNFYGPRNPNNFVKALEIIYEEDPNFFKDIVFRFVGRWIGNAEWKIEGTKLPVGLIEVSPPVSYLKSLAEMNSSDILLILDAPFSNSVFFPSKLVDYIGSGKPIMAITPNGSCLDILSKVGGEHASPESVESITLGIRNLINKLRDGTLKLPEKSYREKFSNKLISRKFEILFKQLINN
jgi:glycosyltransferase involved in cell wall biosynthesis